MNTKKTLKAILDTTNELNDTVANFVGSINCFNINVENLYLKCKVLECCKKLISDVGWEVEDNIEGFFVRYKE